MSLSTANFRSRLLLLVALSIIPAVALSLYANASQRRITEENVQREAISAAQLISAHQDRLMESTRQFLLFLTHLPYVRSEDSEFCATNFATLRKRYPLYSALGVARSDGTIFCSGSPTTQQLNIRERPWFREVLSKGDFVVGEYQVGRVTGEATMTFASPVLRGPTVTGVAFVALNLGWLDQIAAAASLPPGTVILVVDRDGKILVRYPESQEWAGKNLPPDSIVSTIAHGGEGTAQGTDVDGVERLYAFAPLSSAEQSHVSVVIGIPTTIAFAEVNRLLLTHLLGLGIVAILSLALAWFWSAVLILRAEEANLRLAAIVESSSDAIIGMETSGKITTWNEGARRLYGFEAKEATGRSLRMLQADGNGETAQVLAALKEGKRLENVETTHATKDGRTIYVSLMISPIRDSRGRIIGASGIARDITERKKNDLAQSEFVSLASHQLRSPLTAIRWSMEMLLENSFGAISSEQKKVIDETMRYAVNLGETIDMMLTISRIDAGKIRMESVDIHAKAFLDDLLAIHHSAAEEKKLTVRCECPADLVFSSDPTYLKEIIGNLVANAIRYTPEKGRVTVRAEREREQIHLSVADTGYGIPPHEQGKIFSKFFRAENAMKKVPNGTGLGLYLAHALTQMLGGTLTFTSQVNKGTTFSLTLPLHAAHAPTPHPHR